ncbi:MAG: 50S ribosomal protein L6 [Candidatus Dadabacteria bacterium]|nr:50S ribosomal protein L6 [Candidatus Dadabacteria bacterium]NIV40890.1 50S ribosomal protein L6 [Candidatus Dadabacteria bacterium]NIX16140.1 50S ribosomal protein L6 [Candidatus Dadabacteria bacterium]
MSRIGNNPITVADNVKVEFKQGIVKVTGPKGNLSRPYSDLINIKLEDGKLTFERSSDDNKTKALHGLTRSLVANMVTGVSEGFTKTLEIVGVGYKAEEAGKQGIKFSLGYSNPIDFKLPEGISSVIEERGTRVILSGIDKEVVGQTAAKIRQLRVPDAYKGKGVRYQGEQPRLKPGKSGAKTGA